MMEEKSLSFHRNLRKAVKSKRRRSNSVMDAKYCRWQAKNRYNIDQVPVPFVVDQDKTHDVTGSKNLAAVHTCSCTYVQKESKM